MRISDWSSDVCSSDLIRRNSRHACRYGHQPSGDQSANLDWRTGASGIATTRNSAATPQPKPGSGQEEYDGRAGRYLPAVLEGTYDISRSEEHTSELQSLMRISYAVFCLKKKKKNKKRVITTNNNKNK